MFTKFEKQLDTFGKHSGFQKAEAKSIIIRQSEVFRYL